MIYQTKLTDPPDPKKFKKMLIKEMNGSELKFFLLIPFLGHPVDKCHLNLKLTHYL